MYITYTDLSPALSVLCVSLGWLSLPDWSQLFYSHKMLNDLKKNLKMTIFLKLNKHIFWMFAVL